MALRARLFISEEIVALFRTEIGGLKERRAVSDSSKSQIVTWTSAWSVLELLVYLEKVNA